MRAIWTGTLSFGLVHIPVRLYSATHERALGFRLLDKNDLTPISYQKVSGSKRSVGQKDVVRGYPVDGRYVVLTKNDLKRADARKSESIEIVQFADSKDILPELYDKPYYIEPQKHAKKAYALLRDALEKSGRVGITRFVLREKEHIGALSTDGRVLMLEQLRFVDEIRSPRGLDIPGKTDYAEAEMQIAMALIDSMSKNFDPRDFKDTYAHELRRLIAQKANGRKLRAPAEKPVEATDVTQILEMLKKSLEALPAASSR